MCAERRACDKTRTHQNDVNINSAYDTHEHTATQLHLTQLLISKNVSLQLQPKWKQVRKTTTTKNRLLPPDNWPLTSQRRTEAASVKLVLTCKPCKPSSASPRNQVLNITPRSRLILAPSHLHIIHLLLLVPAMMTMLLPTGKKGRRALRQAVTPCPGSVEFRSTWSACSQGQMASMPWGGPWECPRDRIWRPLSLVAASRCGFSTPQSLLSLCAGIHAHTENKVWKRRVLPE